MRVRDLCARLPKGGYRLKVIDIHQLPGLAREYQIVATPTLIKESSQSEQRFIGSLGNISDLCIDVT